MKKRGQLNISFGWIFAIIIGAVILFLAIYAATKGISIGQQTETTKTAKDLGVIINSLETGFESAKKDKITMPLETRIYNGCEEYGNFGNQLISTSEKNFDEWATPGLEISFPNRYIFSKNIVEGQSFTIMLKPFEFPYKVSDLIYLVSTEEIYCFVDAPNDIEDEIGDLKIENFLVEECPADSINVCFGSSDNCDVEVNINGKMVRKDGDVVYFEGDALMYAAIFSDKVTYECHLKRLMKRVKELAELYRQKDNFISSTCSSGLNTDLSVFISSIDNYEDSSNLYSLKYTADILEGKNKYLQCSLW